MSEGENLESILRRQYRSAVRSHQIVESVVQSETVPASLLWACDVCGLQPPVALSSNRWVRRTCACERARRRAQMQKIPGTVQTVRSNVVPATDMRVAQTRRADACPKCHGAGWLRQNASFGHPEFGKAIKCVCKLKQQANDLFGGAHIPDDFQ